MYRSKSGHLHVSPNGPLASRITINITLPDGRGFEKLLDTSPELFNASRTYRPTVTASVSTAAAKTSGYRSSTQRNARP
jgi:hypothetical protein